VEKIKEFLNEELSKEESNSNADSYREYVKKELQEILGEKS